MDDNELPQLPVAFVPTPTREYRAHRKAAKLLEQPGKPSGGEAPPAPPFGARVLLWKQDPSVGDIGTRKAFLPGVVLEGPRDARIASGEGIAPVAPNAFGDFISKPGSAAFDAVHAFTVARQVLTMYQRALGAQPLPWHWNSADDASPLLVYPHGLPDVMNAYYSRGDRSLKFGDFVPSHGKHRVFCCRSFDIVAHETGHAVLDGLKPNWLQQDQPPQAGALHEAFGDLTAIFLALSQLDQCEAIIAQTKANLHDKTFLADIAEQFGLALGRPNGLRNADNDLSMAEAGSEVHAMSQVFTGAVYDILADVFAFERAPERIDDAALLHQIGAWLRGVVLRALIAAPDDAPSFADVAIAMPALATSDGKPSEVAEFIRRRFALRGVPEASAAPAPAVQDRRACCGTMNLPEYREAADLLDAERQALRAWCAANPRQNS